MWKHQGGKYLTTFSCINYWRRQRQPTPVLLPGKSHGRRSLVGCNAWGCEESDTTEQLHFHFSLSCIAEGNGDPLQCSCLENPRDRGAWWAAIYGVTQSRTQLKWLSSSSCINCNNSHDIYHGPMYFKHSSLDSRTESFLSLSVFLLISFYNVP